MDAKKMEQEAAFIVFQAKEAKRLAKLALDVESFAAGCSQIERTRAEMVSGMILKVASDKMDSISRAAVYAKNDE